jgi:phage-related protein
VIDDQRSPKPCIFIGSSRRDLSGFPDGVRVAVGHALYEAQCGEEPVSAKALQGFGGRGVLEIIEDFAGDAYRAVYTVRLAGIVYVLHAFQKKSKRGAETPKHDIELIRARLRAAEEHHRTVGQSGALNT